MGLGIRGIGGLGGVGYPQPQGGGAGAVPPGSTPPRVGMLGRGVPSQSGSLGLGQLSQALGLGKLGAGLTGNTELAGGLGMAGGALTLGTSLSRIASGKGTPMDYLSAARAGYNIGSGTGLVGGGIGGAGGSGLTAAEMAALNSQAGAGLGGAGELALTGEGAGTAGAASSGAAAGTVGAGTAAGALGALAAYANADMEKDSAKSLAGGSRTLQRLQEAGVPLGGLLRAAYTPQTAADISSESTDKWLKDYMASTAGGVNAASPLDWAKQTSLGNPNRFNEKAFNAYIQSVPGAASQLPGDLLHDWQGDVMKNWSALGLNKFHDFVGTKEDPQYEAAVNQAISNDPRFLEAWDIMGPHYGLNSSSYESYQP